MLATMVGSANGRSISALTKAFPRKSSRTNTQATSVPSTTLITATMSDTTTVMRSAARAFGVVTAFQKVTGPSSSDLNRMAASGSNTMMLSQSVAIPKPIGPTPPAPLVNLRTAFGAAAGWGGATTGAPVVDVVIVRSRPCRRSR